MGLVPATSRRNPQAPLLGAAAISRESFPALQPSFPEEVRSSLKQLRIPRWKLLEAIDLLIFYGDAIPKGFQGGASGKESACQSGRHKRHGLDTRDAGFTCVMGRWMERWEDLLEEGMATHSSILAWRIPWTEELGGLQFTGPQRIGRNRINLACMLVPKSGAPKDASHCPLAEERSL